MNRKYISIRYQLIFAFILSSVLGGLSILFLSMIMFLVMYAQYSEITVWMSKHLLLVLGMVFVLYLIFVNLFYLLMTKPGMKDLEKIMNHLKDVSKGELDKLLILSRKDELGELAEGLNKMQGQLQELRKEEKLLEKTKNELITNVSHDLRTPLTSVLGYLNLIQNSEVVKGKEIQKYAQIACDKGMELSNLVEDLFEYTKVSSSDIRLEKKKIDLKAVLEQSVLSFIPAFEEASMSYRINFCEYKVFVNADGNLLARLFENLLLNAIKYGKEGRFVDINLHVIDQEAIAEIVNYGEPIDERDLPYIFERFYKGDKARTRQGGSSGLGLAIVKQIALIHKGRVWVTSNVDCTTFSVALGNLEY